MRLVSRLDALERRVEAFRPDPTAEELLASGARFGVVWSSSEVRVDPAQARPGEHIAVDLYLDRAADDVSAQLRTRERFSGDPADLGVVYDCAGARVGVVLPAPPGYFRWRLDDGTTASAS